MLHGILEGEMYIGIKVFDQVMSSTVKLLLDGTKVHGLFDDVKLIIETQCNKVDRSCKDPAVIVSLYTPEYRTALTLQFGGW